VEKKKSKTYCQISKNMAANLRLRQDDKVKVVPLASVDKEEARSGDLVLLLAKSVPVASSITFSPVEDTLESLKAAETQGDEIPDEELMARFIEPYMNGSNEALLKAGNLLSLQDENGKKLDFLVTNMEVAEIASKKGTLRN
jgi:hypothetical protein